VVLIRRVDFGEQGQIDREQPTRVQVVDHLTPVVARAAR
jgi:hypothetical protein